MCVHVGLTTNCDDFGLFLSYIRFILAAILLGCTGGSYMCQVDVHGRRIASQDP